MVSASLEDLKEIVLALAGVAQWIEDGPRDQGFTGSIPFLGHMPGLWARSLVGGTQDTSTH